MKQIDIRLQLDDELIAFMENEMSRLRIRGRAAYITQLIAAAYLARNGDLSLAGMFSTQATHQPPARTESDDNTTAVDQNVSDMF